MIAKLLAFLVALKEWAGLITDLVRLARRASKEKWVREGRIIAKNIATAETDEDRRRLVKRLARHK